MLPAYNAHYWENYREQLLADSVSISMQKDGEYYPFSRDNFGEALSNMNQTKMMALALFVEGAQVNFYDKDFSASAGECLRAAVWDYWKDIATEHYKNQIQSPKELYEDGLAEAKEAR